MIATPRAAAVSCAVLAFVLLAVVEARQQPGPLKNETIVSMVKGGMPDSLIVSTIQTSNTAFDVSPAGMGDLKAAGVGTKVIDAMVAADARTRAAKQPAAPAANTPRPALAPGAPPPGHPYVRLVQDSAAVDISVGATRLARADTKNQDLRSLSSDGVLADALQQLSTEAVTTAVAQGRIAAAAPIGGAAATALGGLMRRKPTVVYVWALSTENAGTSVPSGTPTFEVSYSGIAGVNASEYEPVIVKLVPARNGWRLVGAAKGDPDTLQSADADWDLYSSFSEDRIPTRSNSLAAGRVQVVPGAPLSPGEYAIVLRPLSKKKKFSGADLANQRGDAAVFNAAWPFVVRPPDILR